MTKETVGVITLRNSPNYGSCLQTSACSGSFTTPFSSDSRMFNEAVVPI